MKKYIIALGIILIVAIAWAATTFKKDTLKIAWYDSANEHNSTVYASMDSAVIKIDPTNDSGYLIVYDNVGTVVLTVSATAITLGENLLMAAKSISADGTAGDGLTFATNGDVTVNKNLFIKGYRNTFLDTSVVNDSYGFASTDITAYTFGLEICFRAKVANTDGATLQINALGALAILKKHDAALATNDIEVGQLVVVKYDTTGTDNWQMISQIAN